MALIEEFEVPVLITSYGNPTAYVQRAHAHGTTVFHDVINLRQPFVYQLWTGINRLLDPLYRPIRRFLPNLGGIDLAPMVLIIGILFVQRLIIYDLYRALA